MKKTLLFFILLFSNYFYAQVSDIEHCYGDTSFNLTTQKTLLIGNLNPAETTVSYHLSLADATDNLNAIANPANYTSAESSRTIYARIDNNGSVTTNYFNIKVYDQINFTPLTTAISCFGQNNGIITILPSGGKAPYTYSLDRGPFTVYTGNPVGTFTNLSPGPHTITLKDALGCTSMTQVVQITEPPLLTAEAKVEYVNCVPRIVISGSGGNSNYEYSHFGVTYTQNNAVINPSPGNQTVYVRDGNGCVASKTIVVESLKPLSWLVNYRTGVTCSGGNDGTFQVTGTGGKAPYLYSIGNEFTTMDVFKNLSVGNYTVKIKDATGCTIFFSLTMPLINPAITINPIITNDSNATNEGKINLMVSGGAAPYNYSLKDSNGKLIPSKTTNPFTGLAAGSYEAIVTDSRGCILSQKGINILNEPTPLTTTAAVTPITCVITTGTITITPNGGTLPYQYSIDNGNTYSNSNVFSNLNAGTYNLKVLDAQNALVSATATINPIKIPEITTTQQRILCHGDSNGSITGMTNNGKSPVFYSINGGPYTSYSVFENLAAGNYTLSAKDANGCIVSTTVLLEDPAPITAEITYFYRTVTVNASGGYGKYQYALDGGSYQDSRIFGMVTYGNHTISIKDPNKCTVSIPITVVEPTPLVSSYVVDKGTVTITTSGGITPYNYMLRKSSGFPLTTTQSNVFTNLINGSYDIIVSDAKGGQVLFSNIIISESIPFTASATSTLITCTDSKATLTVTPNGGSAPYQYSMSNPEKFIDSNVFSNLNAGSYGVTVRDSNGSRTSALITISGAKPVLVSAEIVSQISCNSSADGIIKANVTQGQSPYTYALDNGPFQTSDTFKNVHSGTHTIKVLDKNGCQAIVSVTLSEPTLIQTTLAVNGNSITALATGGTPPYRYSLESNNVVVVDPQNSNTFNNLPARIYKVRTIDANGCYFQSDYLEISPSPVLSASAEITPIDCNTSNGRIIVTATGGLAPYEYSIDNGNSYTSSNVFSNLIAGSYLIKVKDSQATTASITAVISPANPLTATAFITKTIDCLSNGTIDVIVSGGNGSYQYSIDNGVTYTSNPVFTNLIAGTYSILVKDTLNCTALVNAITLEQPVPLTATVAHTPITNCYSPVSDVVINAVGGTVPYQYSLNGLPFQSSSFYTGVNPGNYILEVRDANGCSFSTVFTIEAPVSFVANVAINQAQNCNDFDIATITAIGGQPPYTYSFNESNTFLASNTFTLTPGTYTLKAKDSNGCIAAVNATIAPRTAPDSTLIIINATTATSNDGALIVNATGGTAPYTYTLLNSNNTIIVPAQSANTFNNLAPGTYSVIVKDAKGCSSLQNQVTISAPYPLLAVATVIQPGCNNPMGTITVTASGGVFPYQYSMDNGVTYNLSNTFTVSPGSYSIKVRDANNAIYTFVTTIVAPNPLHLTAVVTSSVSCVSNGAIMANAIGGQAPYTYSINGSPYQTSNNFMNLNAGVYAITVRDTNNCTETINLILQAPIPIAVSATIDNQNITVTATGGTAPYQYSLDLNIFQSSNTFTVFNYGMYQVSARDAMGCIALIHVTIDPPAPLIGGKKTITIDFKPGQTLGDLVIEGQNIKWYSTKGLSTGKTSKTSETPLPPNTILVDGVTYYASQTIDGIESTERLAVTAKVNGSLATPDFVLQDFRFYPNPVQHNLSIQNPSVIDKIELISVSGKTILTKSINHTQSEIDLSNVATGFYFLKVKAEGQIKTIKIVKK
ncbi:T9SS type A sorting domain-containing protein [Flavobacterium lipolyticum]|uniref:T9SS type A sorting domain-containing protein n=1 Tax=Flavobacterium lipolyticum TaxID=2893754 RepID=A0ABS8M030_9FLAO|nr:T9SS type A sorting domain-containing protein [Flavobacterium sp. F-126]MCC9018004.1 T9SS type A sorting domain-containing protein [Flavobacterium sp. F-126]